MAIKSTTAWLQHIESAPIDGLSECCFLPSLIHVTYGISHERNALGVVASMIVCCDCGQRQET